jgi:hypothetical protein
LAASIVEWSDLVSGLCRIVSDYRTVNGRGMVTPGRVERWAGQFERYGLKKGEMRSLISGLSKALAVTYFSKARVVSLLSDTIAFISKKAKVDPSDINFLSLQEEGKSQPELLRLVARDVLKKDLCISGSGVYLYLDDIVYSGNRFRYDLADAINKVIPVGSKLYSIHLGMHSKGETYAIPKVYEAARGKAIGFHPYKAESFQSDRAPGRNLHVLWPQRYSDRKVAECAEAVVKESEEKYGFKPFVFRSGPVTDDILAPEERWIMERAFLLAGIDLVEAAANKAPSMRPMGFEVLPGLGFGALTVTYRNIANNCPLALWYGDPDSYPASHPLGRWFPLFPRKV